MDFNTFWQPIEYGTGRHVFEPADAVACVERMQAHVERKKAHVADDLCYKPQWRDGLEPVRETGPEFTCRIQRRQTGAKVAHEPERYRDGKRLSLARDAIESHCLAMAAVKREIEDRGYVSPTSFCGGHSFVNVREPGQGGAVLLPNVPMQQNQKPEARYMDQRRVFVGCGDDGGGWPRYYVPLGGKWGTPAFLPGETPQADVTVGDARHYTNAWFCYQPTYLGAWQTQQATNKLANKPEWEEREWTVERNIPFASDPVSLVEQSWDDADHAWLTDRWPPLPVTSAWWMPAEPAPAKAKRGRPLATDPAPTKVAQRMRKYRARRAAQKRAA
jgi:hypothetical protein